VKRWLKFNAVGAMGIVVQLAMLALLVRGLHWNYLAATALAVEAAVLHNFVWHEHYTWRDRGRSSGRDLAVRLLRFHLGNGAISILGNLVLMRLLVGSAHLHYLAANLLTIALCSVANFLVSDRLVFRGAPDGARPV
jgi:putative flippase GtrA